MGIDASFAGRVLEPFQSMVMADYADRWHGVVGSRGKRAGEGESRLLLTGLPRGSFGLELTRADNDELFEEGQLADTLARVTKLVEAAGRSDEDFAAELESTAPRVIQNLREFLEVVAKGRAGLRVETGDFRCTLDPTQAREAFNRVAGTITSESEVEVAGILKGVLLESWRFDFLTEDGLTMGGKIHQDLTEEQVTDINLRFFNKRCLASVLRTTVLFKNGRARTDVCAERASASRETDGLGAHRGQRLGVAMQMKTRTEPFEVLIPDLCGTGVAERVMVDIPLEWDGEVEQWLLTPEAHRIIEDTKARRMGLLLPEQFKELRERYGYSQREMGEVFQVGEKSWLGWESGKQRPSRSINLLVRALYDGEISVNYLLKCAREAAQSQREQPKLML